MPIDKDVYYTFGVIKSDPHWRIVMLNGRSSNYTSTWNIFAELFGVRQGWLKTEAVKKYNAVIDDYDYIGWETKEAAEIAAKEFFEALYLANVMGKK